MAFFLQIHFKEQIAYPRTAALSKWVAFCQIQTKVAAGEHSFPTKRATFVQYRVHWTEINEQPVKPVQSNTSAPAVQRNGLARVRKLFLLDSASGYPADEPVEEKIVRDRHWNTGDQGAGHDLAPEEDVAADEIGRHAKRDRLLIRRGYESQRVD